MARVGGVTWRPVRADFLISAAASVAELTVIRAIRENVLMNAAGPNSEAGWSCGAVTVIVN